MNLHVKIGNYYTIIYSHYIHIMYLSNKIQKLKSVFTILLFLPIVIFSKNKQNAFNISYNYQIPIGKISERFGHNSAISMSFFSEKRNNLFIGVDLKYLFGGDVKENTIFNNIDTENGYVINSNGNYSNIKLMQRGIGCYLFGGYAIHLNNSNLSGFYLSTGIGYLEHKIFIDTQNEDVPQLNQNYKKGYDMLNSGMSSQWTADYKYYSKKGNIQLSFGINYIIALTKYRRDYLFNEMDYSPNTLSIDQLIGFKTGVIILIKKSNEEKFHYY